MLTRNTRRRVMAGAVTVAISTAAFVFVIPRIASYGSAWIVLEQLRWPWIVGLGVATLVNIVTFALPWMVALPGLGIVKALAMTQASTAFSSLVPGGAPVGMAASFGILRSWGFGAKRVALAVTLTGVWNQISVFVFPVIAVGLLAAEGAGFGSLALLAFIGLALFVVITGGIAAFLARPRLAFRVGELASRVAARLSRLRRKQPPPWGDALVGFRSETLILLRHRWLALTATTLVNQLTGYLMLELSLRAVGIPRSEISAVESFAAWSVGRLIVSLPLTPGGIGLVEVGLVEALIGFGGTSANVVAAVLAYRALSLAPTLLLGVLASATWRLQTRPANSGHS